MNTLNFCNNGLPVKKKGTEIIEDYLDMKIATQRLKEIEEGSVQTISLEELEVRLGLNC